MNGGLGLIVINRHKIISKVYIMTNLQSNEILNMHLQDADYIRSHTNELINDCVKKYNTEEIKLYNIVEGLQPSLTNKSPTERALGVQFLADILQAFPPDKINAQEITFLSQFFIDRLRDQHSVVPHAIVGIISLVKQENISGEDVKSLIQALFREVYCQSQILADRRNIYSFLKFCVLNKIKDIEEINDEFILGFISAVEGEKDPRNLVLLFSFFPIVAKNLNLKSFAEDLFELVAAYFPIDFVPPKRDGFVITVEDLTEGLRKCLASTESFAPYLIPLLQEKLDSDVVAAKLECFLTLQACCRNYPAASLRPHVLPLWVRLRREVIEGWKEELEQEATTTLSCLVEALEKDPICRSTVEELGSSVMMECVPHLTTPEQRLIFPSTELLLAVSKNSAALTEKFCENVLPLLFDQFNQKTETIARKNTMIVMAKFLSQGAEFRIFKEGLAEEPLVGYRASCFDAFYEGLQSSDKTVKEAAATCVANALRAFDSEQIRRADVELTHLLLATPDQNMRKTLVNALLQTGKVDVSILEEEVLPRLLTSVVGGAAAAAGQVEERVNKEYILDALASLSFSVEALKKVLPNLWEEILGLTALGDSSVASFISCLKKMIKEIEGRHRRECLAYLALEWNGVARFHFLAIYFMKSKQFVDVVPILESISSICQALIQSTNSEDVSKLLDVLLTPESMFVSFPEVVDDVSTSMMTSLKFARPEDSLPEPLEDKDVNKSLYVYCTQDLILRYDVISTHKDICQLLSLLKDWSRSEDRRVGERAASTFALYILNIPTDEELRLFLKPLEAEFCGPVGDEISVTSSVLLFGWVVRSLVVRAYSGDLPWIEKLEKLLLRPLEAGKEASQCYSFLLKEEHAFGISGPEFRPKSVKVLYQQRFFERRIGHLVRQFKEADGSGRDNTLLAISYLLPCLPQAVLKGHLENLLPVLVCGLKSKEAAVTSGAVDTLSFLLSQNAAASDVTPQLGALVPSLLDLCLNSSVTIRVKSLECIEALTQLSSIDLMNHKPQVILKLKAVLNDQKRVVRRCAASARSAWVLL